MRALLLVATLAAHAALGQGISFDTLQKLRVNGDSILTGSLKVGDGLPPGQRVHITNGNVLIDGTGETSMMFKRNGTVGSDSDPIFQLGRVYEAGIGRAAISLFWFDADSAEKRIWSFEATGTMATISSIAAPGRQSHYEAFLQDGDTEPVMRLNSSPDMRLELGPGGNTGTDIALTRDGSNTFGIDISGGRKLQVNGSQVLIPQGVELRMRGAQKSEVWLNGGNQTATSQRYMAVDASGGSTTETMTSCSGNDGLTISWKKVDATGNTVTIDPPGSETIDGASTLVLSTQNQKTTAVCISGNWYTY
jgi:hypothetical protein